MSPSKSAARDLPIAPLREITTVHRIVRGRSGPATLDSLRSHYEQDLPPRDYQRRLAVIHDGPVCVRHHETRREPWLRAWPKIGRFLAEIQLEPESGFCLASSRPRTLDVSGPSAAVARRDRRDRSCRGSEPCTYDIRSVPATWWSPLRDDESARRTLDRIVDAEPDAAEERRPVHLRRRRHVGFGHGPIFAHAISSTRLAAPTYASTLSSPSLRTSSPARPRRTSLRLRPRAPSAGCGGVKSIVMLALSLPARLRSLTYLREMWSVSVVVPSERAVAEALASRTGGGASFFVRLRARRRRYRSRSLTSRRRPWGSRRGPLRQLAGTGGLHEQCDAPILGPLDGDAEFGRRDGRQREAARARVDAGRWRGCPTRGLERRCESVGDAVGVAEHRGWRRTRRTRPRSRPG